MTKTKWNDVKLWKADYENAAVYDYHYDSNNKKPELIQNQFTLSPSVCFLHPIEIQTSQHFKALI